MQLERSSRYGCANGCKVARIFALKDSPARIFSQSFSYIFYTFAIRFVNVKNNEYFRGASLIIITIRHVWYNFCTFVRTIKVIRYQRTRLHAKMRFNRVVRRSGVIISCAGSFASRATRFANKKKKLDVNNSLIIAANSCTTVKIIAAETVTKRRGSLSLRDICENAGPRVFSVSDRQL